MTTSRLVYGEMEASPIEQENPYTGLPETIPAGPGWSIPLTLEQYDPEDDWWNPIDTDAAEGMTQEEAESEEPYTKAENRLLARNHITRADINGIITPW